MSEEKNISYQYSVEQEVSVNFLMDFDLNGEKVGMQVTARYGSNAAKITKTVEETIAAATMLRGMFPKPVLPAAPAPVTQSAPSAPKPATTDNGGQYITVCKVKVTPEKDGKTRIKVEVFEPNMKYPSINAFYNDPAQATAAWGMVTGLDFSAPGEYNLEAKAYYRNSEKLNQKGNPYKNLVSVTPLD
jgi:hypothetical protein